MNAGYGKSHVLFEINFECRKAEIVAVVGPNGSGKTTLLNSIFGLADIFSGTIMLDGTLLNGLHPYQTARMGVAYLLQTDNIFEILSVKENLKMGGYTLKREEVDDRMNEVLSLFPVLKSFISRKATTLSGGERQMLGLASMLMRKPKLIMLDEPTAGLAPLPRQQILKKIVELKDELGISIILVEQNTKDALEISDRSYLIVSGKNIFTGKPDELLGRPDLTRLYLGLEV